MSVGLFLLVVLTSGVFTSGVISLSHHRIKQEWNLFKLKFNRNFTSVEEEFYRYTVFVDNRKKIHHHNIAADKGHYSYWLGINEFADLTEYEFETQYTGLKIKRKPERLDVKQHSTVSSNLSSLPKEFDWRNEKCVTPVKHQGVCGSCYAFAATGALEGRHCIKKSTLVSLSEQNILDCTDGHLFGNDGCGGGQADFAFQYVIDNGGIDTEESYPYVGYVNECKFKKDTVGATAKDYKSVAEGSEFELQRTLFGLGPVAVCIDARGTQFYESGVYDGRYVKDDGTHQKCSKYELSHAMLLVGYGRSPEGKNYWLIKNSWGVSWGIEGYMKLIRNNKNTCGIATLASYPVI